MNLRTFNVHLGTTADATYLSLGRYHAADHGLPVLALDKLKRLYVVIHLDDVLLDTLRLAAAEDAQQLVVRDEEKPAWRRYTK